MQPDKIGTVFPVPPHTPVPGHKMTPLGNGTENRNRDPVSDDDKSRKTNWSTETGLDGRRIGEYGFLFGFEQQNMGRSKS